MKTENVSETIRIRSEAFKAIRAYFYALDYFEVDAPVLIRANAVEEEIDPLFTRVARPRSKQSDVAYLMTSPEIHMKRLLAHGLSKIFCLSHVFRDNELSPIHRPEFMMLEWYRVSADLDSLIRETEHLFAQIAQTVLTLNVFHNNEPTVQCEDVRPFERLSVAQAWDKYAQIDLLKCLQQIRDGERNALQQAVQDSGEHLRESPTFEDAFIHIMLKKVEPNIGARNPVVLYGWPAQTASLAKLSDENPLIADRFEIYWKGFELANAFSELTDGPAQNSRFHTANAIRASQSKSRLPIDDEFIRDLENMPSACGIAIGIDRLLCLLIGRFDLSTIIPLDYRAEILTA